MQQIDLALSWSCRPFLGGGTYKTKVNFLMVPRWILLSLQYIRTGKKEFLNLKSVLTLHIDPQHLKITIWGSKIRIVTENISARPEGDEKSQSEACQKYGLSLSCREQKSGFWVLWSFNFWCFYRYHVSAYKLGLHWVEDVREFWHCGNFSIFLI